MPRSVLLSVAPLATTMDPATANAGLANASLVESNIRTTLHAFEDENHDGMDDHGGADDPQPHD